MQNRAECEKCLFSQGLRRSFSNLSLIHYNTLCRKLWERVSPILVMLMSHSDFTIECSNISLKENKWDDVDLNSNDLDNCVRKKEGKIICLGQTDLQLFDQNDPLQYHKPTRNFQNCIFGQISAVYSHFDPLPFDNFELNPQFYCTS